MSEFILAVIFVALLVAPIVMRAVDLNRLWRGRRLFTGGTIPTSKIGSIDASKITGQILTGQVEFGFIRAPRLHADAVTRWALPNPTEDFPHIWSTSLPVPPPAEPSTPPQAGGRLIRRTYPAKRRRARGKGKRGGGR